MQEIILNIAFVAVGYLLGSIPCGLLLTKVAGLGDIRKIGSKSTGATNVLRTGRKDLALLTVLLDAGKAALAYGVVWLFLPHQEMLALWAGFAAVMGHNFPVWLSFKGGKGIATAFGLICAANWEVGVLAFITWLIVVVLKRYVSLASIVAAAMVPLYTFFLGSSDHMIIFYLLTLLVIACHHQNIRRLMNGTESKIGQTVSLQK